MPRTQPTADRFIRAVRRRLMILRPIEGAAIGTAIACAFVAAALPILWWRGLETLPLTGGALLLGAILGVVRGAVLRPSLLDAATEADRQLELNDLLGTVVAMRASEIIDEQWARIVRESADVRCRSLAPTEVIVHRLGLRAWTSVGVATSLVLTLAMLASTPDTTRAGGSAASVFGQPMIGDSRLPADSLATVDSNVMHATPQPQIDSHQPGEEQASADVSGLARAPGHTTSSKGGDGANDSNGSSAGSSHATAAPLPRDPENRLPRSGDSTRGELVAGGAMGRSTDGTSGEGKTGMISSVNRSSTIAPWQSDTWPADQKAAADQVRQGQVPDAYRDLVRHYFDADGSREQ